MSAGKVQENASELTFFLHNKKHPSVHVASFLEVSFSGDSTGNRLLDGLNGA